MINPQRVRERHMEIHLGHLPEAFDGFRILHLTDLHLHEVGRRERHVLEIAERTEPDAIVLTGDFIDRAQYREPCLDYVGRFSAPHGVWGVLGNWDHYSQRSIKDFGRALESAGVRMLNNAWSEVRMNGSAIALAGVDDPHTCHDDMRGALEGQREEGVCVLLAHSPDIIDQVRGAPVDVVLSGHTHGGQVCLPGGTPLWVPSRHGGRYAQGRFEMNGTTMIVSRGIGTSMVPVRVFCPPEVIHVTLRGSKNGKDCVT